MSSKKWRNDDNICTYSSTPKDFNFDTSINIETILTSHEDSILIWYDESIRNDEIDDQYSFSQLQLIMKSFFIFTNEQKCLEFINKYSSTNKLFLIVSGSLGKDFIPKIYHLLQINGIYIFCGQKIHHESWAKKYEKIKGVFDNVVKLCECLKRDKQKFDRDEMYRKFMDSLSNKFSSSEKFNEFVNIKNPKYDDPHQPKDDIKIVVTSADIPFSKEEISSSIKDVEINTNIHHSETVAPYLQYKQQMEFSDTGIWPCVSVVDSNRDELFNHVHSTIETVKYFNSTENFVQHLCDHPTDPHLVVISNPTNIEQVSKLIRTRVRKVYIYCSNNRLKEYDAWSQRYSHIVSVLQYFDTLNRLILWDLSACIVDIANYYDSKNEKKLAQARYNYVYRLHVIIQGNLNNGIEMIQHDQRRKLNN